MRRERRHPPARVSWAAATSAYLLVTDYTRLTRQTYRSHLKRAGRVLGKVVLGKLRAEHLEAYRAAVLTGRSTKAQALAVTRVFLVWASELGLVELRPAAIRELLRPPGAVQGVEPMGRTTRWREQAAGSSAETLAAFGYPCGAAGWRSPQRRSMRCARRCSRRIPMVGRSW